VDGALKYTSVENDNPHGTQKFVSLIFFLKKRVGLPEEAMGTPILFTNYFSLLVS
jgi:hypothetical protein